MPSTSTEISATDLSIRKTQHSREETIILSDKNRLNNLERKITIIEELLKTLSERESSVDVDNIPSSSCTKSFCDYVKQLTSISTFHGLPNITTNKQVWLRLFWLLLMTAGFGLAVWQSARIFTEYFQFPVSTHFEIHNGNLTFPQVTICNYNPYMKSKVMGHPAVQNHSIITSNGTNGIQDFRRTITRNLPEQERILLSHNISDFIGIQKEKNITLSLLPTVWFGNCYTLRTRHQWSVPDSRWGFLVHVNIQTDEYVHVVESREVGAVAYIRETGLDPITFEDNSVHLKPGEHVEVGLNLETINRLGGKYGNCHDDEEKFRQDTGMNYSQDVCRAICSIKTIISECGCYPYDKRPFQSRLKISKIFRNVPECNGEGERCFQKEDAAYNNCVCKPRCHMNNYSLSVSRSKMWNIQLPCNHWPDLCKNASTKDSVVQSNVARMHLYFDNVEHKVFTQVPSYSLYRFLSDIGGTFGLYIGASVLTLFELPQLVIVSVIYLIRFIREGR